jgi:hypothetical protein
MSSDLIWRKMPGSAWMPPVHVWGRQRLHSLAESGETYDAGDDGGLGEVGAEGDLVADAVLDDHNCRSRFINTSGDLCGNSVLEDSLVGADDVVKLHLGLGDRLDNWYVSVNHLKGSHSREDSPLYGFTTWSPWLWLFITMPFLLTGS